MIRKGDTVKIKQEWQDEGDAMVVFIAVDDEDKGRVTIEAQIGMIYNPQQVVRVDMLEAAE